MLGIVCKSSLLHRLLARPLIQTLARLRLRAITTSHIPTFFGTRDMLAVAEEQIWTEERELKSIKNGIETL